MSYLLNSFYFLLFLSISFGQTFSWENDGTILGSFGDNIQSENVSSHDGIFPYDGDSMLKLTESPLTGTPQGYLACIKDLNPGDVVSVSFYTYDNVNGSPSARIWGGYATNLDITDFQGSAGGNASFPEGTGWEELSHTWTIPEGQEALVIQARLYSASQDPTSFLFDSITVTAPENATVIFPGELGDSIVGCTDPDGCNFNPDANYEDGSCTYPEAEFCDCFGNSEEDCNGVCGGSAVEDIFSICGGDNTIQNAIDNAQENDVIIVPAGTYFESLEVYNSVSIVCEDFSQERSCILDARGLSGSAVTFSTSQARLEGFTILGDSTMFAGVTITPSSQNIQVINNTIYGMTLSNPGNDSPLSYGVLAYGNSEEDRPQDITILGNDISMIGGSGISLGDFTGPVMIGGNNIHDIIPVEVLGQPFSAAVQGRFAELNFENNIVSNVIIGLSIPSSSGSSNNNSYSNVPTYLSTTVDTENEFEFNQNNDLNYWISETTLENLGLSFVSYVNSLELATMIADSGSNIVSSDGVVTSQDCNGDWGGTATTDNCGTCDSDSANDCPADCNGVYGGSAVEDACGVCDGDNSSCSGCDGVPNSGIDYDGCGICGGNNFFNQDGVVIFNGACGCPDENGAYPQSDCNGICDFDSSNDPIVDECGVCGGDNSSCTDCNGVLNGFAVVDDCGMCGGNNYVVDSSSCSVRESLIPNVFIPEYESMPGDGSLHFINENDFYVSFSRTTFYPYQGEEQSLPERIDFSDVSYDTATRVFLGTIDFSELGITHYGASKWSYEITFSPSYEGAYSANRTAIDEEGNVLSNSPLPGFLRYCDEGYFEGNALDCAGECDGLAINDLDGFGLRRRVRWISHK